MHDAVVDLFGFGHAHFKLKVSLGQAGTKGLNANSAANTAQIQIKPLSKLFKKGLGSRIKGIAWDNNVSRIRSNIDNRTTVAGKHLRQNGLSKAGGAQNMEIEHL